MPNKLKYIQVLTGNDVLKESCALFNESNVLLQRESFLCSSNQIFSVICMCDKNAQFGAVIQSQVLNTQHCSLSSQCILS